MPAPHSSRALLRRTAALFLPLAALPVALSACTPAVEVAPAPASDSPACAPMMVALPEKLQDFQLREATSQGTAAWGDPSKVVLRCGVDAPGPTTDPCANVDGIDWLIRQTGKDQDTYSAVTYGRTPTVELTFKRTEVDSSTILGDMTNAVSKIPQQHKCLGPGDSQDIPTVTPSS